MYHSVLCFQCQTTFKIPTVQVLISLKELNHFRYEKMVFYNARNFTLTLQLNICTTVYILNKGGPCFGHSFEALNIFFETQHKPNIYSRYPPNLLKKESDFRTFQQKLKTFIETLCLNELSQPYFIERDGPCPSSNFVYCRVTLISF